METISTIAATLPQEIGQVITHASGYIPDELQDVIRHASIYLPREFSFMAVAQFMLYFAAASKTIIV